MHYQDQARARRCDAQRGVRAARRVGVKAKTAELEAQCRKGSGRQHREQPFHVIVPQEATPLHQETTSGDPQKRTSSSWPSWRPRSSEGKGLCLSVKTIHAEASSSLRSVSITVVRNHSFVKPKWEPMRVSSPGNQDSGTAQSLYP